MSTTLKRAALCCALALSWTPLHAQEIDLSGSYWGGSAQSGWGLNLARQGDSHFATWVTFDASGAPIWLVAPRTEKIADWRHGGPLYQVSGPRFDQLPWNPTGAAVKLVEVGRIDFFVDDFLWLATGDLQYVDMYFLYMLDGSVGRKDLIPYQVEPQDTCAGRGTKPNYHGQWWGGGAESGWGLHLNHQADTVFATWLTFDANGRGLWVVMPNGRRIGTSETFAGALYRATGGPSFDTGRWDPAAVSLAEVGNATLAFNETGHGTFTYTLLGVTQSKAIVRQTSPSRWNACRER